MDLPSGVNRPPRHAHEGNGGPVTAPRSLDQTKQNKIKHVKSCVKFEPSRQGAARCFDSQARSPHQRAAAASPNGRSTAFFRPFSKVPRVMATGVRWTGAGPERAENAVWKRRNMLPQQPFTKHEFTSCLNRPHPHANEGHGGWGLSRPRWRLNSPNQQNNKRRAGKKKNLTLVRTKSRHTAHMNTAVWPDYGNRASAVKKPHPGKGNKFEGADKNTLSG